MPMSKHRALERIEAQSRESIILYLSMYSGMANSRVSMVVTLEEGCRSMARSGKMGADNGFVYIHIPLVCCWRRWIYDERGGPSISAKGIMHGNHWM
jgi:hypothetical protein